MSPDPAEATGAYDARDLLPPPAPRRDPWPAIDRAVGVVVGSLVGLWVLLALGCAGAAALARPVEGGTADEAPPGWCACP